MGNKTMQFIASQQRPSRSCETRQCPSLIPINEERRSVKPQIQRLIAILMVFLAVNTLQAAAIIRGVVLFDEPPQTYVQALEFVTLETTSVAYVTASLPDGKKREIPRTGIVAVINYPTQLPTEQFPNEAATTTQNIQALRSKYPQYVVKLDKALAAWTTALAVYQQKQKSATTAKPATPSPGTTLEMGDVNYTGVILTSFDGAFVGIEHAAGFARIPVHKLKPEQIAALNGTTSSVRIDPAKIVQEPPATTPPRSGDAGTTTAAVIDLSPEDATEIGRLKRAASAAEAVVRKLKDEEAALKTRLDATPYRSNSPELLKMNIRMAELNDQRQQAQFRYQKAVGDLERAELNAFEKGKTATVEAYRAAATLPVAHSDWDSVVKKWSAEVDEQTRTATAAESAAAQKFLKEGNTAASMQLSKTRDAEREKLGIAKAMLAQAKERAAESARENARQAMVTSDRLRAQKASDKAADEAAEELQKFKSHPINNEVLIVPPVVSQSPPSYDETLEFLGGKFGLRIGFGEKCRKLIFRQRNDMTYTFDPKDINPEVTILTNVNAFGVQSGPSTIVLGCRNGQRKIELFRAYGEPEMISEIQVSVRDSVEADKLAKALSHLASILGATKEAF